ncbi:MAG: FtsX-like permease family protein [Clostridia bacterium]|nr:FtsX-like permease family protein [Clostridia bacterium]
MEILTLLKANIRHKKGSFISIIILMTIIAMSLTAILSIRKSNENTIANELERVNAPTVSLYTYTEKTNAEFVSEIEQLPYVSKTTQKHGVHIKEVEFNGESTECFWFASTYENKFRLLNDDLSGYRETTEKPRKGEIFVPQSILTELGCHVGDEVVIHNLVNEYKMRIAAAVVEPTFGNTYTGDKYVFINEDDLSTIYEDAKSGEIMLDITLFGIYKTADCDFEDAYFKYRLNNDTKAIDKSLGAVTREDSFHNTNKFTEIITSVLLVFVAFLSLIVLIVIIHSITTSIEQDYTILGILKAIGFTKDKIRLIFLFQYLTAMLIGSVIGFLLSFPLTIIFGNVFQPITAIPVSLTLEAVRSLLIIFLIILTATIVILFGTIKIGKISPVRAVSGGRNEIYFNSMLTAPISKKFLSASLALRQFTTNKKKHISTILITAILIFFMLTVTALGDALNSKTAMESIGIMPTEVDVFFKNELGIKRADEIEKTITKYSPIQRKYYYTFEDFKYEGNSITCLTAKNPDTFIMISGQAPELDNEVVITEFIAEQLHAGIGDKIKLSSDQAEEEYLITGIFQTLTQEGYCIGMNFEGAQKLIDTYVFYGGYSITDPSKALIIGEELNHKFGDILECEATMKAVEQDEVYNIPINAMKAFIYTFSVIFALVVVIMVCHKAFLQEKTDIGIYKALGFTTSSIRMQFAIRFLIVSAVGSLLGSLLSIFFSEKLLVMLIRSMGVASFRIDFLPLTFIIPILIILTCFFVFAYIISRKVKDVNITTLIAE